MTMYPFFTVIIPTYNRASLIGKAIQSVIDQTYANWELIIIDDGSTDSTREIVASFSDYRIKYVYQQNQERCAARNQGIALARGRYICFLDSDDYYLPERLRYLHDALEVRDFPVEMFYTPMLSERNGQQTEITNLERLELNIYDRIGLSVIHSQQICAAAEIFKVFQYDIRFRVSEDMELWLRIATKFKITFLKNHYTIVVVDHQNRSINLERFNSYKEQLTTLRHIFSSGHPGKNISSNVKYFLLSGAYHGIAKFHIYHGNRFAAIYCIFRALLSNPLSRWTKLRINILLNLILLKPLSRVKKIIDY